MKYLVTHGKYEHIRSYVIPYQNQVPLGNIGRLLLWERTEYWKPIPNVPDRLTKVRFGKVKRKYGFHSSKLCKLYFRNIISINHIK